MTPETDRAAAAPPAPRRLAVLLVAATLAFAVLVALGTWQLQRLAWKEDLIARVAARVDADPVPLPPAAAWDDPGFQDAFEYQPVSVTGAFAPKGDPGGFTRFYVYTVLSDARGPLSGQGYWVFDLFRPAEGGALYVNRGFVPRDAHGREADPPAGETAITGLVRIGSAGNTFTPACDRATAVCYAPDVAAAAGFARVAAPAPVFLDLAASFTPPGGLPQAGETRVSFPNNHLHYALTWFGLAAALVGVTFAFVVSRRRKGRDGA